MFLEILTPSKQVYVGEVKLVRLPGIKGSFEILTHHAPIISTLTKGIIKVLDINDKELLFEIEGGFVENKNDKIIVLGELL